MSLEFNNEGEINAKQTNRNIILVLLLSLMSVSLAQNQLEFGLKSANPSRDRERKREREWERGKVERGRVDDKGPNGNLNMSPVGQSRQSIKMARKNKTNNNSERIKRKKNKFLTL